MNAINRHLRAVCLVSWVIGVVGLVGCSPSQRIGNLRLEEVFKDDGPRKLAWAAAHGDEKKIDGLLAKGVSVNVKGKDGITPLCWAVWSNNLAGVRLLLEKGANPNVQPEHSAAPMEAAARQNADILKLLIQHGGDVNLRSKTTFGYTPLHGANIGNNVETTKLLINADANLETKDSGGLTPFFHACVLFHYDQAILLLEAGADYTLTISAHDGPVTVWTELKRGGERLRENSPADVDRRRLLEMLKAREAQRQK